jgi:glycosyltransferase involved in cell wall biosynthesis
VGNSAIPPARISVAIATFNGCPFFASQLESIAAQTRIPDEILIGDDRSTDGTAQAVDEFKSRHPHLTVRFERNAEHLGTNQNFDGVVRRCSGDIIVFADQDDIWMPNRLARVAEMFAANSDAAYVFSDGFLIDQDDHLLTGSLFSSVDFSEKEKDRYLSGEGIYVLLRHNVVTGAALAVRSTQLRSILPFQIGWQHDYYLAFVLEATGRGVLLDEPLIRYRCHQRQQVGVAGRGSVRKILAYARKQSEDYCRQDADNFRSLRTRLIALGVGPDSAILPALVEKSDFLDMRVRMRAKPSRFLGLFWRGWRSGYYWRYALGWKQVIVDAVAVGLAFFGNRRNNAP